MQPSNTMDFIRYHGVVLEAARGAEPCFVNYVAGEPIKGSWWGHAKGHEIYAFTTKIHDSRSVLICTLAGGKITYIHRRLWPYFVLLSKRFPFGSLDKVQEVHLPSGRHQRQDIPFPQWVPDNVASLAVSISTTDAGKAIGKWVERYAIA